MVKSLIVSLIASTFFVASTLAYANKQHTFASFEEQHMHDTHKIEVADEVTFFKLHDLDGDGFWDDRELCAMYGLERDVDPSAVHVRVIIDRAFAELDTDHDSLISLKEYMRSKLPEWTEEEIKAEKRWRKEHRDDQVTNMHQTSLHVDTPQWEEEIESEQAVPDKYRMKSF